MNDDTGQGCMVIICAVAVLICGMVIGGTVCNSAWEKSAKSRGVMKHNQESGVLEWTVERKKKT